MQLQQQQLNDQKRAELQVKHRGKTERNSFWEELTVLLFLHVF
jgi:hypothetical protein